MVESHNAQLGRLMSKKGRFFSFLLELRMEVKRKDAQLLQLQQGKTGVFDEPAPKYVLRSKEIKKQEELITAQKIGWSGFLCAVTCTQNRRMAVNLCDVERPPEEGEQASQQTNIMLRCIICEVNAPKFVMVPCNHLAYCSVCYEAMKGSPCPECGQDSHAVSI